MWWQDVIPGQSTECEVVWCEAEHPLFKASNSEGGSQGRNEREHRVEWEAANVRHMRSG